MSRARANKAGRIAGIRARTVEILQLELAGLMVRAREAASAVVAAKRAWEEAASAPPLAVCTSGDLAEAHAFVQGLARRVDALAAEERVALAREEAGLRKLVHAKTELRKIENWRDRLLQVAMDEESAHERRTTDEVAARIARDA
jgi:flagellar export protein FliJ